MQERVCLGIAILLALPVCSAVNAQAPQTAKDGLYFPVAAHQTEADEYT
ncbi:MAG: hypothetical protein JWM91_700, partial [Rhodospirillales bacterium]|nr:hypothetical protein [Rhodospirillales bacterium]